MELVQGRLTSPVWTLSLRLLLRRTGSEETEEGSNIANWWSRLLGENGEKEDSYWRRTLHISVFLQ